MREVVAVLHDADGETKLFTVVDNYGLVWEWLPIAQRWNIVYMAQYPQHEIPQLIRN